MESQQIQPSPAPAKENKTEMNRFRDTLIKHNLLAILEVANRSRSVVTRGQSAGANQL